jgi:SAM-dependent methyltransferase
MWHSAKSEPLHDSVCGEIPQERLARRALLPAYFAIVLFTSAALLFIVQPLIAKALLPLLGGSPSVWTTCMLFFQAGLLAGYAYAHWGSCWAGARGLMVVHGILLMLALFALPPAVPADAFPPQDCVPVIWLLQVLLSVVGLPFFVLAASAPLVQAWFARIGHSSSSDPYYLYAASNAGSLLALVAYPFAVEPWAALDEQAHAWALAFGGFAVMTLACAALAWRQSPVQTPAPEAAPLLDAAEMRPGLLVVLAFIPSSLLLGVTTYATTDVAAIPLLWIVPLVLYLLTFIVAFARRSWISMPLLARVLPIVSVAVAVMLSSRATEPIILLLGGHLLLLAAVGLVCHGELARRRPSADRLTAFYLWIALGGALGGVFNGAIAPLVFSGLVEYPLVLALACVFAPSRTGGFAGGFCWGDLAWPIAVGLLQWLCAIVAAAVSFGEGPATLGIAFALPALACWMLHGRPVRFGLGVAALLLAGTMYEGNQGVVVYRERSFFGVHRVVLTDGGAAMALFHGNTIHGKQWLDPAKRREPLLYFHPQGPAGSLFAQYRERSRAPVAVIGLGAGALAAYGQPGQEFVFYELDPAVIRIARNPSFFTYLSDSEAKIDVVAGDARLMMASAPAGYYGLIVLDAFSSDAIPVHLLTREALALYRSKLKPGGLLAFHVSNRYVDLLPILGDLAGDCGWVCVSRNDWAGPAGDAQGRFPSQWALMAETSEELPPRVMWQEQRARPGARPWTDQFSNLAGALR